MRNGNLLKKQSLNWFNNFISIITLHKLKIIKYQKHSSFLKKILRFLRFSRLKKYKYIINKYKKNSYWHNISLLKEISSIKVYCSSGKVMVFLLFLTLEAELTYLG